MAEGFVPPPYPHDRLAELVDVAAVHEGGPVDLSVGTPNDPPPATALAALSDSISVRGYPPSVGTPALRRAAARWMERRFGVSIGADDLAVCVGTKEFVAGVPHWLRLRDPSRDTVLYPAISYPTYAMGATLAGARAVAVPTDSNLRMRLEAVDPSDVARALCLWVNSPSNPTGALEDLADIARWGRANDVVVFSDECYADYTWRGAPRTILESGPDGVVAVHSLSKRSNFAGARVGFYAGDPELVHYLSEVRKHMGLLVPGPVQEAAVLAYDDDHHVELQRDRYRERLEVMSRVLTRWGLEVSQPDGGFYLWIEVPGGDAWALTRRLAVEGGVLVSPGDFYGPESGGWIRVAMVQPPERLEMVARRLGVA